MQGIEKSTRTFKQLNPWTRFKKKEQPEAEQNSAPWWYTKSEQRIKKPSIKKLLASGKVVLCPKISIILKRTVVTIKKH